MTTKRTARTVRTAIAPSSTIATLATLDAIIAFAIAHVTAANIVDMLRIVRDTFGRSAVNRNVGRVTGWRVMHFQNMVIARFATVPADKRPTMVQLVFIGACEFPTAVGAIFAPVNPATNVVDVDRAVSQWSGTIALINTGRHANVAPTSPVTFEPGIERKRRTAQPAPVVAAPADPIRVRGNVKHDTHNPKSPDRRRDTNPRLVKRSA